MTQQTKRQRVYTEPALAVTIDEAAHMVGISRAQFYRIYLDTGRVVSVPHGHKSRVIDVQELQAAYGKLKDEIRADQVRKGSGGSETLRPPAASAN